jgi:ketosteroid isomerase-like protein
VTAALLILEPAGAWAETAQSAIEAANTKFAVAFDAGDAAGVAALYTEDTALLLPAETHVDGWAGVTGR